MPLSEVYYMPNFISKEHSDEWYKTLLALDSCVSNASSSI